MNKFEGSLYSTKLAKPKKKKPKSSFSSNIFENALFDKIRHFYEAKLPSWYYADIQKALPEVK